jgi:uncharacterized membrane protein
MNRVIGTFIAGLLVVLPIMLTIFLVVWVGRIVITFVGPNSTIGHLLIAIGFGLSAQTWLAYLFGLLIVAFFIYVLGVMVESRLQHSVHNIIGSVMQRIPLIGYIYDLAKRLIAIIERKDDGGFKNMQPVWCFFGGEGGAAVLALLPAAEPIMLGGEPYHIILVPSAPVPVGGGLIYVPAKWVKPADVGIEGLMSIYVSMGVSVPKPTAMTASGTRRAAPKPAIAETPRKEPTGAEAPMRAKE